MRALLTFAALALLTIWFARRRPRNVVSDAWMRENRYPKDGY